MSAWAGETLFRVGYWAVGVVQFFAGKTVDASHYDYDGLDNAYRKYPFVRRIVKLSAGLVLSNGFELTGKDPKAVEDLTEFWDRNRRPLRKGVRDGGLYGNACLGVVYSPEEGCRLVVRHPGQVAFEFDQLVPEKVVAAVIVVRQVDGTEIRQRLSADEIEVKVNGKVDPKRTALNSYGLIPMVHVAEDSLSHEQSGTGVVNEVLYRFAEMYLDLAERTFDAERYHGGPVACATGVDPTEMEEAQSQPGRMLVARNAEAKFFYLETQRGTEGMQNFQEMLYHGVIVESGVTEFMLGVHMKSSEASTSEQRKPLEIVSEERRDDWAEAIVGVSRIVLRMLEVHEGRRYSQERTVKVEWGPVFDEDKQEEATTEKTKIEAEALAVTAGLRSRETAVAALNEDEGELERIEAEGEARNDERGTINGERTGTEE